MSPKEIKKLADACRKAGIKSFKNAEVEFTLADELPVVHRRTARAQKETTFVDPIQPDAIINDENALSEDDLLFWSSRTTEENQ